MGKTQGTLETKANNSDCIKKNSKGKCTSRNKLKGYKALIEFSLWKNMQLDSYSMNSDNGDFVGIKIRLYMANSALRSIKNRPSVIVFIDKMNIDI